MRSSEDLAALLAELQERGRSGRYREAIRAFLQASGTLNESGDQTGTGLGARLQYAIALQHPGLYKMALDIYEQTVREAREAHQRQLISSSFLEVVEVNCQVQRAVLLERLERPTEALGVISEVGDVQQSMDLGLAKATLRSWIDVTVMKCSLTLGDTKTTESVASRCCRGDWNQQLWGRLFLDILTLADDTSRSAEREAARDSILKSISSMHDVDRPGMPWLGLTVGRALYPRELTFTRQILAESEREATTAGKFYNVAAASEQLSRIYARLGDNDRANYYVRRAIAGFEKCGLLLLSPFYTRLYKLADDYVGEEQALQVFEVHSRLQPPGEMVFARMCSYHAKLRSRRRLGRRYQIKAWQVFEEFVRDWALTRYPGRLVANEAGQPTADVIVANEGKATVIQAKHYQVPKHSIPKSTRLRDIAERHRLDISRYVFVISTSDPDGWRDEMWHKEDSDKIRNLVPDRNIAVDIVTEPVLQTDVLLNPHLHGRYFSNIS